MKQFSRILAAVDLSKSARSAFDYALALSQHHGAELVVIHAVEPNEPFSWQARARLVLTATLRQRAEQAAVEFKDRIQQGDPAEIILLHAHSLRPDLIVLGTHQRRGIDRLRAGSVAERVATKATVPVLVVPGRRETGLIEPFRHVAVAVDFSPISNRAIEQALSLASDPADRITLLHVVPGFSADVPPQLYHYGIAEYQNDLISDARRRLQRAVPIERRTAAAIHTRVLVGDTATEISRVADSIGADVLVVGVPKRGLVSRTLFGTTAGRLLKTAGLPVLTVPDVETAVAHDESTSLQLAA